MIVQRHDDFRTKMLRRNNTNLAAQQGGSSGQEDRQETL